MTTAVTVSPTRETPTQNFSRTDDAEMAVRTGWVRYPVALLTGRRLRTADTFTAARMTRVGNMDNALRVYAALDRVTSKTVACTWTVPQIAAAADLTPRATETALKTLAEGGHIIVQRGARSTRRQLNRREPFVLVPTWWHDLALTGTITWTQLHRAAMLLHHTHCWAEPWFAGNVETLATMWRCRRSDVAVTRDALAAAGIILVRLGHGPTADRRRGAPTRLWTVTHPHQPPAVSPAQTAEDTPVVPVSEPADGSVSEPADGSVSEPADASFLPELGFPEQEKTPSEDQPMVLSRVDALALIRATITSAIPRTATPVRRVEPAGSSRGHAPNAAYSLRRGSKTG